MQLRDYQLNLAQWVAATISLRGLGYLAMEVRTGKTVTAFQTAVELGAKRILFVTKLKAKSSIEADSIHFPSLDVTITNYEQLGKIVFTDWDLVIVDEAHALSAFPKPSKRAKDLKQIAYNCPILYLSGTPSPEGYSQIFHQLWISKHSPFNQYKDFYKWARDYVDVTEKWINGHKIKDYSKARWDLIEPIIKPLMYSYTQEEAGFANEVVDDFIKCPPPERVSELFDVLQQKFVLEDYNVSAPSPATLMTKLHQLGSGHLLNDDGEDVFMDTFKVDIIKERFRGQHIAIFYKYKAERTMLLSQLDNVTENVDWFQTHPESIFIGQIQSIREGVKLDTAECIVILTQDFSATSYQQARARLQNKDREGKLKVYYCINPDGIDKDVYKAVANKKNFTLSHFKKLKL